MVQASNRRNPPPKTRLTSLFHARPREFQCLKKLELPTSTPGPNSGCRVCDGGYGTRNGRVPAVGARSGNSPQFQRGQDGQGHQVGCPSTRFGSLDKAFGSFDPVDQGTYTLHPKNLTKHLVFMIQFLRPLRFCPVTDSTSPPLLLPPDTSPASPSAPLPRAQAHTHTKVKGSGRDA